MHAHIYVVIYQFHSDVETEAMWKFLINYIVNTGRDRKSNFTLPLLQHAAIYQTHSTRFSLKYGYPVTKETGKIKNV